MDPNPSKYLLPSETVILQCPEIAHRAMMIGTVAADLISFVKKEPLIKSAYEIAKRTHHHKAQVYSIAKVMEKVGNKLY